MRRPAGAATDAERRRRYRLQAFGGALAAAGAVCLPWVLTTDAPAHEWGGVILVLDVAWVTLLVLAAVGVPLLVGRTRPAAAAVGRGAFVGLFVGGVMLSVLPMLWPNPPANDLLPPPIQRVTATRGTSG